MQISTPRDTHGICDNKRSRMQSSSFAFIRWRFHVTFNLSIWENFEQRIFTSLFKKSSLVGWLTQSDFPISSHFNAKGKGHSTKLRTTWLGKHHLIPRTCRRQLCLFCTKFAFWNFVVNRPNPSLLLLLANWKSGRIWWLVSDVSFNWLSFSKTCDQPYLTKLIRVGVGLGAWRSGSELSKIFHCFLLLIPRQSFKYKIVNALASLCSKQHIHYYQIERQSPFPSLVWSASLDFFAEHLTHPIFMAIFNHRSRPRAGT